jgi:hypothetical protein
MAIHKNKHSVRLLWRALATAFFVALAWAVITRNKYNYNKGFVSIFGISVYPLFSWTLGLFLLYAVYAYCERRLKKPTFAKRLGFFLLLYWPPLITVETVAYHFLNIRNVATAAYAGLPLCNCIHAPLWMQIGYFSIGIAFFLFIRA